MSLAAIASMARSAAAALEATAVAVAKLRAEELARAAERTRRVSARQRGAAPMDKTLADAVKRGQTPMLLDALRKKL